MANLDFLWQIQRIRRSCIDEVSILRPGYLAIVVEYKFLFDGFSGGNLELILVLDRLQSIAQHVLHLLSREGGSLGDFWTIRVIH